jgi:molybdate transport repressor ModE-like protein
MDAKLQNVTLRQLRVLAAVARQGGVTAAAKHLHVTQPAVTLQIRSLEDLAGAPLFQRTATGRILTQAGEMLMRMGERMEIAIADCTETLDMMKGLTGGRVAIGVVSTAKYFAPFAIAAFTRAHPGIAVKLTIGNRGEIIQALEDFSIDIAIIGRPPAELELSRELIGDHPHLIIAPPDHRLKAAAMLTIADLGGEIFLNREQGSGTRALMERIFAEAGIAPRFGMEIASNETIKQAVMAGLGIAFLSAHTVASEIADGRLVCLPVTGLPIVRHWFVVHQTNKILLPPARALLDFMKLEGARFLPDIGALRTAPMDSADALVNTRA